MRYEKVIQIRPVIELIDSDGIEKFQNDTLRPILKFQSPITQRLLTGSNHFLQMLEKINPEDKKAYEDTVNKYVNFNVVFKNRLVGIVVGFFTHDELSFYMEYTKELNKRIINMQIKRFVDNKFPI